MFVLPDGLIQTTFGVHQDKGQAWLDEFETLLRYCEERWSFRVLDTPFPLSYHFVAPVVYPDGSEAVLKLGVPCDSMRMEMEALRLYNGRGIVRLLDADADRGIMLLERVKPGDTLKSVPDDEEATLIAAGVMRQIRTPAPGGSLFPSTVDWAKGFQKLRNHFQGGTGPLPEDMVNKAEQTFAKLNGSIKHPQLLHGDLHHDNLLLGEGKRWLAIDPKGLIGEAEYGVIPFLMNHLPDDQQAQAELTARRVDLLVRELGLNKERVLAWGYCHGVLSAWWCVEDQVDGMQGGLDMATLFDELAKR
ncbi:kinase [Paenibacillus sp. H1-7]|uniref:aminoglycoside phosphotransferase family protein n=1 Tax=Paenibacillus sp. H1-7 TaxID=2282849 RepID=UPI001EF9176D|nr:aminoglycoside phosphotransferase family protein [Paenibacillus sp. H1-7]ULL18521.1 kinase [Paenibacillus sp. H1-7]